MGILERHIIHDPGTAFSHIRYDRFSLPRHLHREFEIMVITSGCGLQFAGDGVEPYREGDVALLGSCLPHFHLCDSIRLGATTISSGEVLQFSPDLFPRDMERQGDYAEIRELLAQSRRGIRFDDRMLALDMVQLIRSTDELSGTRRLIRLLEILDRLARCAKYRLISSTDSVGQPAGIVGSPMEAVEGYLASHFKQPVSLESLAGIVGRNPSALCRYFRQRTGKTIFESLVEKRVGYAMHLLEYSDLSCSQIAYESGFNNYASFVRAFQRVAGLSPDAYRRSVRLDPDYSRTL